MMKTPFNEQDLPFGDLEKLGLYKNGETLLGPEHLEALLSGRRTELISLHDLEADGFAIGRLDAKLSLVPDWDNKLTIKIHPIYKEPKLHPLLLPHEAAMLKSKQLDSLQKNYPNGESQGLYQFEYDAQTKEFISYDPALVNVPEKINGHSLTEKQKEAFRYGTMVTLDDGTKLQYRASDSKGILSNRPALILSLLDDHSDLFHLLVPDIKNLLNTIEPQRDERTEGFRQAFDDLQKHQQSSAFAYQNSR